MLPLPLPLPLALTLPLTPTPTTNPTPNPTPNPTLRRLQTSSANLPSLQQLAPPLPPVSLARSGALTPEMRGFVRAA